MKAKVIGLGMARVGVAVDEDTGAARRFVFVWVDSCDGAPAPERTKLLVHQDDMPKFFAKIVAKIPTGDKPTGKWTGLSRWSLEAVGGEFAVEDWPDEDAETGRSYPAHRVVKPRAVPTEWKEAEEKA